MNLDLSWWSLLCAPVPSRYCTRIPSLTSTSRNSPKFYFIKPFFSRPSHSDLICAFEAPGPSPRFYRDDFRNSFQKPRYEVFSQNFLNPLNFLSILPISRASCASLFESFPKLLAPCSSTRGALLLVELTRSKSVPFLTTHTCWFHWYLIGLCTVRFKVKLGYLPNEDKNSNQGTFGTTAETSLEITPQKYSIYLWGNLFTLREMPLQKVMT